MHTPLLPRPTTLGAAWADVQQRTVDAWAKVLKPHRQADAELYHQLADQRAAICRLMDGFEG